MIVDEYRVTEQDIFPKVLAALSHSFYLHGFDKEIESN